MREIEHQTMYLYRVTWLNPIFHCFFYVLFLQHNSNEKIGWKIERKIIRNGQWIIRRVMMRNVDKLTFSSVSIELIPARLIIIEK